eukprot:5584186-Pyramimonas_sp.AAC.1
MSRSISLLGCEVSVAPQGVHWHLGREKVVAWQREVAYVLRSKSLSPALASKFAGRLAFACQRSFGRVGRSCVRPFFWRAARGGCWALTSRLRACLRWWIRLFSLNPDSAVT